jgi:hypothetical protein
MKHRKNDPFVTEHPTEFPDGRPKFEDESTKSLMPVVPTDGKGKHGDKLFDDTALGNVSIPSCAPPTKGKK